MSIKAPPSIYPSKKYCDLTGFEAKYTDPQTRLRYCTPAVFSIIRQLTLEQTRMYLEVRKAAVSIK